MDAPRWLHDETTIIDILKYFLIKLDEKPSELRNKDIRFPINPRHTPQLYHGGEKADNTWSCILELSDKLNIIKIKLDKKRHPFDPTYYGAVLYFQNNMEEIVRTWLDMPKQIRPKEQWDQLITDKDICFPGTTNRLRQSPILIPQKTLEEVLSGFLKISEYQNQKVTLRQLSALCFWGDSKFLDNRTELVEKLFPSIELISRPVLVSIFLGENIDNVIFVENLDSYLMLINNPSFSTQTSALVYSAGFTVSAMRVRDTSGASLHFQGNFKNAELFQNWWIKQYETEWKTYFWGDLDYAGMSILSSLKLRFPNLQAWEKGYKPMLESLNNMKGHAAETSGKHGQIDPIITMCDYADTILLPAIRETNTFIDQESVIL